MVSQVWRPTSHIEPGAPLQNPYVESFNGHLRRELLDLELIDNLLEAGVLLEDWRSEYNHYSRTRDWDTSPPSSTPPDGRQTMRPDSHNGWTEKSGSVKENLNYPDSLRCARPSISTMARGSTRPATSTKVVAG
jgi:hypothetical protein